MAIKIDIEADSRKFDAEFKKTMDTVRQASRRNRRPGRGLAVEENNPFSGGRGRGGAVGKGNAAGLGMLASAGPAGVAAVGAIGAAKLGLDAFNASMEREALLAGLAAQSTEDVSVQMVRLRALAKMPGLGMEQVIRGSMRLQSMGMSATIAERTLRELGNALALEGKGKAEMDGVILAMTQISAKGKISAEEINQIAERLTAIRPLMKKAFGTADTSALQKMGLSADQFFTGLTDAMSELQRAQITTKEELSNLKDAWGEVMVAAGNALLPIATDLIPLVTGGLEKIEETVKAVTSGFANLETIGNNRYMEEQAEVTLELAKQVQILRQRQGLNKPGAKGDNAASEAGEKKAEVKPLTAAEQKKSARDEAAQERKKASVEDKLGGRRTGKLVEAGDVDALKAELDAFYDSTVGIFPDFEKSVAGLEKLTKARLELGKIDAAEEAMGWLSDAAEMQEKIKQLSEATAESMAGLREQADKGAFDLLDPTEQAADMKRQLGESLGIDIQGAADVERGLKSLRSEAEDARKAGDNDGEKAALEKLNEAQRQAAELAGLSKGDGEGGGKVRAASGGVANSIAQIFGRASQDDVMLDATRSQVTVMKQLNTVLTRIKEDGIKTDVDTFNF